jgi:hypothetical protein
VSLTKSNKASFSLASNCFDIDGKIYATCGVAKEAAQHPVLSPQQVLSRDLNNLDHATSSLDPRWSIDF